MPAPTIFQKAAFNMIDHLHFTQVYLGFMHSHPDLIWYERILKAVEKRLLDLGLSDKKYNIAKHYLLSSLEIHLSVRDNLYSQMEEFTKKPPPFSEEEHNKITEYTRDYCIAQLFVVASYNGLDTKILSEIYENLISDDSLSLSDTPALIRFRLVDCCFAIDFHNGPLLVYRELLNLGVLSCAKYSVKDDCLRRYYDSNVSDILVRAGLVFELKIMRERALYFLKSKNKRNFSLVELSASMTRRDKRQAADYYKKIIDDIFLDNKNSSFIVFKCDSDIGKPEVEMLLNNIGRLTIHKRMFTGTQASWLGTLGAFCVAVERSRKDKRAIYCEDDNEGTITDFIVKELKKCGFTMSARSLYLRYKDAKKNNYSKIRYYYSMTTNMQIILPWHNDINLYNMAVDFDFSNKKDET
ncbi:hypothetical protein [Raoultella terrigena]|uniref:hypothetical protein n=1 Tax=Raoultella terrigena TaxID=577 RepID=UPI00097574A7|nr:hypothetical protein [Raoultella terrigena]OMP92221.1 hypothetical protein BZP36_18970 [Raoultella terrigena]